LVLLLGTMFCNDFLTLPLPPSLIICIVCLALLRAVKEWLRSRSSLWCSNFWYNILLVLVRAILRAHFFCSINSVMREFVAFNSFNRSFLLCLAIKSEALGARLVVKASPGEPRVYDERMFKAGTDLEVRRCCCC